MDFKSLFSKGYLMNVFSSSKSVSPLKNEVLNKLKQLEAIFAIEGIQARMPFEMEIN